MVHVQTGNMLDVVIEGKSIGLQPRGSDDVLWLPEPEGLVSVLSAEIQRLRPAAAPPRDVEEEEASVCPEDVGFVEYIHSLEKQLNGLRGTIDQQRSLITKQEDINNELRAAAPLQDKGECVLCRHIGELDDQGRCHASVFPCSDDYHGYPCGCKCVFAATPVSEEDKNSVVEAE